MQASIPQRLIRLGYVSSLPWLPRDPRGKCVHKSTVWRWSQKGIRGVKLQTCRGPGGLCTTEDWLFQFFAESAVGNREASPAPRSASARRAAAAQAELELQEAGI